MDHPEHAVHVDGSEKAWSQSIAMETGIRTASCYQCLRCSNSCPVSTFMDLKPHQVVRLVQLGQRDTLLGCSAIWVCLSCEMCSTYCPNEIDVAGLMNHLKNSVIVSRKKPAELEIAAFHEIFLDVLTKHGRMNDLQLLQRFKLKTLMQGHIPDKEELSGDIGLALELLKKKRLKLFPERSRASSEIRRIVKLYGHKGVPS